MRDIQTIKDNEIKEMNQLIHKQNEQLEKLKNDFSNLYEEKTGINGKLQGIEKFLNSIQNLILPEIPNFTINEEGIALLSLYLKEINLQRVTFTETINVLNARIGELNSLINSKEEGLNNSQKDIYNKEDIINNLRSDLTAAIDQKNELQIENKKLYIIYEQLQSKICSLEDKLKEASQLKELNEDMKREKEETYQKWINLDKKYHNLIEESEQKKSQMNNLEHENAKLKEANSILINDSSKFSEFHKEKEVISQILENLGISY